MDKKALTSCYRVFEDETALRVGIKWENKIKMEDYNGFPFFPQKFTVYKQYLVLHFFVL